MERPQGLRTPSWTFRRLRSDSFPRAQPTARRFGVPSPYTKGFPGVASDETGDFRHVERACNSLHPMGRNCETQSWMCLPIVDSQLDPRRPAVAPIQGGSGAASLSLYRSREMLSRPRSKENPDNHSQKQEMDGNLANHREADHYVEDHPRCREPACPIVPAEHDHTCNESQEFARFNPNILVMKHRRSRKVVSKTDGSHRHVQ